MPDERRGNGDTKSGNRKQLLLQALSGRLKQLRSRIETVGNEATTKKVLFPADRLRAIVETAEEEDSVEAAVGKLADFERELALHFTGEISETLKDQILQLQAEASTVRLVTEAVMQAESPFELAEVVAPATLQERPFRVVRDETEWARPNLGTYRPLILDETVGEELTLRPVKTVGKVRLKVRGGDGGAILPHAAYRIVGDDPDGKRLVLGEGSTDRYGYAVADLSNVERKGLSNLRVELKRKKKSEADSDGSDLHLNGDAAATFVINDEQFGVAGERGLFHDIAIAPELIDDIARMAGDGPLLDPDARDLINSPESFVFDTELEDGNCTIRPGGGVATREFFFRQILRSDSPDLAQKELNAEGNREALRLAMEYKPSTEAAWKEYLQKQEQVYHNPRFLHDVYVGRQPITAPIPFGNEREAHLLRSGQVKKGIALTYKQGWHATKLGLGEPLYSLALAPCEEVNLAIIDWSRDEESVRRERGEASERLSHEIHRTRTIDEAVSGVVRETQRGGSASGGGGFGISVPGFSIGGGGGASSSWSTGARKTSADTMQRISDSVVQQASSLRGLRSTVITTSQQAESERIETRTVRNHNKHRAMTVQYSQVFTHYSVRTKVVDAQEVLLVPYDIDPVFFSPLPDFESFRLWPSTPLARFLLQHRSAIEPLLPAEHKRVYAELAKLVHCQDVYQLEEPYVTASQWRVELINGWRPGLQLAIETEGATFPLRPAGAQRGSGVVKFDSGIVRLDKVDAIHITFDPGDALRSQIDKLRREDNALVEDAFELLADEIERTAGRYILRQLTVYAKTDPSPYLKVPQTYRLDHENIDVSNNLSIGNESTRIELSSPPELADTLDQAYGPAHQTYCQLQDMVAYLQERPMEVMRAIWFSEDPDRRAMRLDRYQVDISEIESNGAATPKRSVPLLELIENNPVGTVGNLVAFPSLNGRELAASADIDTDVHERLVSLPTPGVFAEVFLSACSATERRDITRGMDGTPSCSGSAPAIAGITPGSRRSSPNLSPSGFPTPMVNIQNPPAAPDPQGMAGVFQLLSSPDIFRDMSLGEETVNAVRGYVSQVLDNAARNPGGQGAGPLGSSGVQGAASSAVNRAIDAATGAAVRNSDPLQTYDQLQNIERAYESGALSDDGRRVATSNVVGDTSLASGNGGHVIDPSSGLIEPLVAGGASLIRSRTAKWKEELPKLADDEYRLWAEDKDHPEKGRVKDDRALSESGSIFFDRLKTYYRGTRPESSESAASERAREYAADEKPWSAAFISFMMRQAGIREVRDGFTFSGSHSKYVAQSLVNRLNRDYDKPFWTYALGDVPVSIGDLIVKARAGASLNFDEVFFTKGSWPDGSYSSVLVFEDGVWRYGGAQFTSHADIVIAIKSTGGLRYAYTIGGNTEDLTGTVDTVGMKKYLLNESGYVQYEVYDETHDDVVRNERTAGERHVNSSPWAIVKIIDNELDQWSNLERQRLRGIEVQRKDTLLEVFGQEALDILQQHLTRDEILRNLMFPESQEDDASDIDRRVLYAPLLTGKSSPTIDDDTMIV